MKLYIDSARITDIAPLMKTGAFSGVTTNPLLLRGAGVSASQLSDFAGRVVDLGVGELFLQSWGEDEAALSRHGRRLAEIAPVVVVKLPATREGFEAAARLAGEGVRICITAVYAPFQAVLADAVGAAYVAPYLGRMNDAGRDGHGFIARMAAALRMNDSPTGILAASVRSPDDLAILAENGVRCVTLAPAVADTLFADPLTCEATRNFEAAARVVAE